MIKVQGDRFNFSYRVQVFEGLHIILLLVSIEGKNIL